MNKTTTIALLAMTLLAPVTLVRADGIVVDKVYHPYVDALAKEVEYRAVFADRQPNFETPAQVHQVSIGKSFGERTFGEIYLVGSKARNNIFHAEAYEMEWKWQLTEQGEYSADWGMVFEYEEKIQADVQEIAIGLVGEKEFGRWSGTANFFGIREWGDDIFSEYETQLNLQARYRYSRAFEPGVEFYAGQDTRAIGPMVQGQFNLGVRKSLHWEAGVIFGLDEASPDSTYRLLLEYEF